QVDVGQCVDIAAVLAAVDLLQPRDAHKAFACGIGILNCRSCPAQRARHEGPHAAAQNAQARALSSIALTSKALALAKKSGMPIIMSLAGMVLSICLAASMNATSRSKAAGSMLPQSLPPLSL